MQQLLCLFSSAKMSLVACPMLEPATGHVCEPWPQPAWAQVSNSPSSPIFSLPTMPILSTLHNQTTQDVDSQASHTVPLLSPVVSPDALALSDEQFSGVALSASASPRPGLMHATERPSRPMTSYQFAHPAPENCPTRLRRRPRLLLQLQQVSQSCRPMPTLDISQSTLNFGRVVRNLPVICGGRTALGPNDLVFMKNNFYERMPVNMSEKNPSFGGAYIDPDGTVATICHAFQGNGSLKYEAVIHMESGQVWEATSLPSGSYEFVARSKNNTQVVRWALRRRKHRAVSSVETQTCNENRRFTFSVIDPNTRRHPILASMMQDQLKMYAEYSIPVHPSTTSMSTTSSQSVVSDTPESDVPLGTEEKVTVDEAMRILIIVSGVWVALREGWPNKFGYRGPKSAYNEKVIVSTSFPRSLGSLVRRLKSNRAHSVDGVNPRSP